jgi:hypothetical protein
VSELCSSSETEANLETELLAPIELNTKKIQIKITNLIYNYDIQAGQKQSEIVKKHKSIPVPFKYLPTYTS